MNTFSAQVERQVADAQEKLLRVFREAVATNVEEMLEAGVSRASARKLAETGAGLGRAKKDGTRGRSKSAMGPVANPGARGNLPVDTGFLRASFVMTRGGPAADSGSPEEGRTYTLDDSAFQLIINNATTAEPIFGTFTASYARRVEYGFSGVDAAGRAYNDPPRMFVRSAAQNWPEHVRQAVAKVKGASLG